MTLDTNSYSSVPIEILVSYLPAWLAANTADDPDDSVYRKVLAAFADALARPAGVIPVYADTTWLPESTRCMPRLVWTIPAPVSGKDPQIYITVDDYTVTPYRVESMAEFMLSEQCVYAASTDGQIYIRGLAQIDENGYTDSGDYHVNFPPIAPDEPVWLKVDDRWELISTLPGVVDAENGIIRFEGPGDVTIKYSMGEAATDRYINVDGKMVLATCHDMWNSYDEAALLVSLSRIEGENNHELIDRIKTSYRLLQKSGEELARSLVGHELGLVGLIPWTGASAIDLTDLGVIDVTYVTVLDLEKSRLIRSETLVPDSDNRVFTSAAAQWDTGWMLFINGTRVTNKTYPALDYSAIESTGRVDFGVEVTGDVTATYTAAQYTAIGSVVSPTPNTPHGSYTILYARQIEAHSTLDSEFLSRLLGSDGLPTELYMKIAEAAAAASPILVGRTGWGDGAHWFDDTEATPPISHLPVPIK